MKKQNKKKALGQIFTPLRIAEFMAKLVLQGEGKTVLDPAVGEGIFFQCLEKLKNQDLHYTAYDVDTEIIKNLKEKAPFPITLIEQDYLNDFPEEKFDIIICNPPYNKFQQIPNRSEYIAKFREFLSFEMSGYSNLCVYFLIKSLNELKENGRCAYILPYEFFNTGYGINVKKYLLESKRLKAVYKFDNAINLFSNATTTSCILFFDGNQNDKIDFISIRNIVEVETEKFTDKKTYSYSEIYPDKKWNKYFIKERNVDGKNLIPFNNIAQVKRGIATGNNKYFCLSATQADHLKISNATLVKCVTKSADVDCVIFTEKEFGKLKSANKKVFLFDGEKAKKEEDFQYIKYGKDQKVDQSFLNSHRKPWFSLEKREVAPIWISVFNRNKLKIVRNESDAKHLTTFHGIYLTTKDQDFINLLFCYLLTPIGQELLYSNKRDYGNGLDKFEPNDLNNAPILNISKLNSADKEQILLNYSMIKTEGLNSTIIARLNSIFLRYL